MQQKTKKTSAIATRTILDKLWTTYPGLYSVAFLIAMSAERLDILVLTANERDYRRLAEFRAFQYQVITI